MGRVCTLALAIAAAACGFQAGNQPTVPAPDASEIDTSDGGLGSFGPAELVPVSSPGHRDDDVTLTSDMLEMYFESEREMMGDADVYVARRSSTSDAWSPPVLVLELSTPDHEGSLEISGDGLTIYFSSDRSPPTVGGLDIFVATRPDRATPWSTPTHVPELSSASSDYNAQPWSDALMIIGYQTGGDVYRAKRASGAMRWGAPEVIPGLDTPMYEGEAYADATEAMWFTGPGTVNGEEDIWRAEPNGDGTYRPAARVLDLATSASENDPWLSPDLRTIFFTSDRNGSLDIFMATR